MNKARIASLLIIIAGLALGYFVYTTETNESDYAIKYGLDLSGGTHLVYDADVSELPPQDIDPALESLRTVIERRVNAFGVSEPLVQVSESFSGARRLIVELPGITDTEEAIEQIGETPLLEFRLRNPDFDTENVQETTTSTPEQATTSTTTATSTATSTELWIPTELTGRFLESAQLQFGGGQGGGFSNEPIVLLNFNEEGSNIFAELTGNNVGDPMAIFLDERLLSSPVIQQEIVGGTAQITGNFTPEEARTLVRDLNLGALPVPIELVSTQTIGASLGEAVRTQSTTAGIVGLIIVALFLLAWYRTVGLLAIFALAIYLLLLISAFKLIPVTLTAAGIAGVILSIGLAVDANVLIFERFEEELEKRGAKQAGEDIDLQEAIHDAFSRAWPSIRDANFTSIISAVVLYWLGTSLVKGFALAFGLGVILSMITAISVTRTFLLAVAGKHMSEFKERIFSIGFKTRATAQPKSK